MKKFLSLILVALMVVTMLPMSVFATETDASATTDADSTPEKGYMIYLLDADGAVIDSVDATKSASAANLATALSDLYVLIPFPLSTPSSLRIEVYEDIASTDEAEIKYDTEIVTNGHTISNTYKVADDVTLIVDGEEYVETPAVTNVAEVNGVGYASVADALAAAKEDGTTDLVITIIGENTADTADTFDLIYTTLFDSVTIEQDNGNKPYYFDELYTGARTNSGVFAFDGVNIVVTGQYMFEGTVKLTNNSAIKSTAEANCFFYYNETTIEPGSTLKGVIEDFRGGDVIVDGGRTDGAFNTTPDMQDAILTIRWSGDSLTLKNGAYVKINSANEVGRLTVSANTSLNINDSKLDACQWIANEGTINMDANSQIVTGKITGAGDIVIDATGMSAGEYTGITADMSEYTGAVEVTGAALTAEIVDGKIILKEVVSANVAEINGVGYPTLAEAIASAQNGETVTLLTNVELTAAITVPAGKTVTLDLAGKTVSGVSSEAATSAVIVNKGDLTVMDSVGGGKITSQALNPDSDYDQSAGEYPTYANNTVTNSGKFTLVSGTIENTTSGKGACYAIDNNSTAGDAVVVIEGGTVTAVSCAIRQFANSTTYENSVTINGGEVSASRAVWMQLPGSSSASVKKADLAVNGGTITSTDETYNLAVYVYTYGDNAGDTSVSITGGEINGDVALSAAVSNTMETGAVSVTGGTFTGDYGVYSYAGTDDANAINAISISGGTFSSNYCEPYAADEGYTFAANADGTYGVGELPSATVTNLGAVTLETYRVYEGNWPPVDGTEPITLQVAMQFVANDDSAEAAANAYADYITDFYISLDGMAQESFVADGCYLAGEYGDFGWILIPLDGMTIENGEVYPIVSNMFALTYEGICSSVGTFNCGIYFAEEILAANPDMTVTLELGLSETVDDAKAAEFIPVGETHTFETKNFVLPSATVNSLGATTIDTYRVYEGKWPPVDGTEPMTLQIAMQFIAKDSPEQAAASVYADYITDFYITIDGVENGSFVADGCYLAGEYGDYGWIMIPLDGMTIENGKAYPVISNMFEFDYEAICTSVVEFNCGIYFTDAVLEANPDMTVTLELGLSEDITAARAAEFILIDKSYVFGVKDFITEPEFLIAGTTVNMGNDLGINFWVPKANIQDDYYAVLVRTYADGSEDTVTVPYSEWNLNDKNYAKILYNGIAAKEMTDEVSVTVYNANGIAVSDTYARSIQAHAMDGLDYTSVVTEKTLYVDMLNYGAAAQQEFDYATDSLANAKLTAEQSALGTQEDVVCADTTAADTGLSGSSAVLNSNIVLKLYFSNASSAYTKAVYTYTDHYGVEHTYTAEQADLDTTSYNGMTGVRLNTLVAADFSTVVTCDVYVGDEVVASATESLESCVYYARLANVDDLDLFNAMAKYANAAYNYLHRNDK